MRRRIAFLLILAFGSVCAGRAQETGSSVQSAAAERLSLDQAIRNALEKHPALKQAEAAVDAAEAEVKQARASYFPQLSFSGIGKVGLSGASGALGLPGFPASPFFRNTAYSANWYQMIFDFGRTKHFVASERALAESARLRKMAEKERIILNVKRAYFSGLEAQGLRTVADETVKERRLTLEREQAYAQSGLSSEFAVSFARANLAEAEGALIQANGAVHTSLAALRAAMGAEGAFAYELQTPPINVVSPQPLEDLVQAALKNRPDGQALEKKVQAASESLGRARADRLPEVRGFGAGGQGRFNGTTVKEEQRHGVGALGLIFPFFTGGRLQAERQEAQAVLDGALALRDALRQQIQLEVTQAYYQVVDLTERINVADQQRQAAQQALALAQARYQVQLSSFLDLLTAEGALTRAETIYARTQFDYERAKAQLDFASGRAFQP